jgi:HSP20 family protein
MTENCQRGTSSTPVIWSPPHFSRDFQPSKTGTNFVICVQRKAFLKELFRKEQTMLARRETPFELLDREFNRMLNRYWGAGEVPSTLAPYAVDVHEDADHFYVEAELPGFSKDEVDITFEDGVLTVRADRKEEKREGGETQGKNRQPLHVERRWTRFERSFTLPTAVNENSVRAALENGVLTITMDKREEVKPRKIQIGANGGGKQQVIEAKGETR